MTPEHPEIVELKAVLQAFSVAPVLLSISVVLAFGWTILDWLQTGVWQSVTLQMLHDRFAAWDRIDLSGWVGVNQILLWIGSWTLWGTLLIASIISWVFLWWMYIDGVKSINQQEFLVLKEIRPTNVKHIGPKKDGRIEPRLRDVEPQD